MDRIKIRSPLLAIVFYSVDRADTRINKKPRYKTDIIYQIVNHND